MKRREFTRCSAALRRRGRSRPVRSSKRCCGSALSVMQPREAPHYRNFLRRMGELGYQEGRNFTFDYIETPNVDGYDKSYQELAPRKPDVFLAVRERAGATCGAFRGRR